MPVRNLILQYDSTAVVRMVLSHSMKPAFRNRKNMFEKSYFTSLSPVTE